MAHEHEIKDNDFSFYINPTDRGIYNQSPGKITLIQGDHNSERFSFRMPRYVEGHDMTLCDKVEVHYNNIEKSTCQESKDLYPVTDIRIDPYDEDFVLFSWLISGNATKYEGTLTFLIAFLCKKDDGTIPYAWHTGRYTTNVSEGMNNSEAVYEEISDVLAAWEAEAIKNITEAALEAASEIFGNKVVELERADKDLADALKNLSDQYAKDLEELQMADEDNSTAIQELTEAYNAKVEALEKADAENKKAIEDHIEAYNKKVIELTQQANNATNAATNAQSTANNAQQNAGLAQQAATNAQTTANQAMGASNAAQSTANNAVEIANDAVDKAQEAQDDIDAHKTSPEAHNDIRLQLAQFIRDVQALLDTDEKTLDQTSEIVAYIKNNKSLIDSITTSKVNVADIIDNLTTNVSDKPLSARQGVALKKLIDDLSKIAVTIDENGDIRIDRLFILSYLAAIEGVYIGEDDEIQITSDGICLHGGKTIEIGGENVALAKDVTALEQKLQWDFVLDNSTAIYGLSGNILIKNAVISDTEFWIDDGVKHLRFENCTFENDCSFYGNCEKISGISTSVYLSFDSGYKEITDIECGALSAYNSKVSDVYINGGSSIASTFSMCSYVDNIRIAEGVSVTYSRCENINPFTCQGFAPSGGGVPMINPDGSTAWVESAEGGEYGS